MNRTRDCGPGGSRGRASTPTMSSVSSACSREQPVLYYNSRRRRCTGLISYHEPYLEKSNQERLEQHQDALVYYHQRHQRHGSPAHGALKRCSTQADPNRSRPAVIRRTRRHAVGMWSEMVNSVISIIVTLLVASQQFTVILAINAVAEGGETNSNVVDNSLGSGSTMFTTKNNTSIIAQRGGVAVLPCSVQLNSQATVSWIRRTDYKLLTVGQENLSSDERFVSDFGRHLGLASLRIKNVREDDKGLYECQLSSYPPQSQFVQLKISEVTTEIGDGATDIHIDSGSQLRLECKLRYVTEVPTFVFWYFGDRMINYDLEKGYLVEDLSKNMNSTSSSLNTQLVISTLIVESVNKKHAGNYSCSPSNAKSAQVTVHVLHGEKPAAMQHANPANTIELNFTLLVSIIISPLVIGVLGVVGRVLS